MEEIILFQFIAFLFLAFRTPIDPVSDPQLNLAYQKAIQQQIKSGAYAPDWNFELQYMTPYAKLNMLLRYQQRKDQNERVKKYADVYAKAIEKTWMPGALRQKKLN